MCLVGCSTAGESSAHLIYICRVLYVLYVSSAGKHASRRQARRSAQIVRLMGSDEMSLSQ